MNVWKIDIFPNSNDQGIACCTLLARCDTEAEAMRLALEDAKARSIHDSPRAVPRGLASRDEAKAMTDQETVLLIGYGH